jgi:NAD(P)-dependent dehydrogenase (short-subunit alcohol dehydrogenase family)
MAGRLEGRTALVTGAGTIGGGWGIGKAAAVLFPREGARLCVVDINRQAAEETATIIADEGDAAIVAVADVSQADQVEAAVGACLAEWGRLDVLFNNVGILAPGGAVEQSLEDWNCVLAVNLTSMFLTCKHAIPAMIERKGGAIVNMSSISSRRYTGIDYVSYPTTKAAVVQFTKVTAAQYGRHGIRCNAILPGFVKTPMIEQAVISIYQDEAGDDAAAQAALLEEYLAKRAAMIPLGHWAEPWDIANAALFLSSDEARYITGADLLVDGGAAQMLT